MTTLHTLTNNPHCEIISISKESYHFAGSSPHLSEEQLVTLSESCIRRDVNPIRSPYILEIPCFAMSKTFTAKRLKTKQKPEF